MNKLSGRKTKKSNICLHRDGKILSDNDLVTTLNSYFTLVNADIPSLDLARAVFLDISKVFDRINHNFVVQKLINIGVRRSIIPWICNFLTCRRQAVKIGSTISQWLPITAGVPQGTKLGPIIFLLMINDLNSSSPTTSNWKYVDDITISEVVPLNGNSVLKLELDDINSWTLANDMNLNPGKCKEIVVCFSRLEGLPPALIIDGESIRESSGLKWNMHVNVKHNHAAGKTRGCIM